MNAAEPSEWTALHRVHDGGVVKSAGVYFDRGHPVLSRLAEVFDWLTWCGLICVADGDPVWSVRPLSLTATGQARYAALGEHLPRHARPLPVSDELSDRGDRT